VFGAAPAATPAADTQAVSAQTQAATQQRADPTLPPPPNQAPQQAATAGATYAFTPDRMPAHTVPNTPIPAGLSFPSDLLSRGDAQRGMETYSRSACIGCHRIAGNRMSAGILGPDLTHIGSRLTIGSGLFSNTPEHMAMWIKNARRMKPMQFSSMPTLGIGETDPITGNTITRALGGLTNEQIADIVAYLMALK
jgi:cytochrome c oxidase subunit 2